MLGVLTFHRCINYGSYWQARCLVEGLRSAGHEAVLLDHVSNRVNRAEWTCALQPTLPTPVPPQDHRLYAVKTRKFLRAFESLPLSSPFNLEHPGGVPQLQSVVVGSDEVWNIEHPWYGGVPLFYGEGFGKAKLIAYAASLGGYSPPDGLPEPWREHLRRFKGISVRDDNSREIVRGALGWEPPLVLDPCLQFPPAPEGEWQGPDQPFIALYGHNFSPAFAHQLRRAADARALPIVSIGYGNDWADACWIDADPTDFALFMARAESVATNFFHGCVFALLDEKPFVCETTPYRANKVRSLMGTVGAEHHLIEEQTPFEVFLARLTEPPSPAIAANIGRLRGESQRYLEGALA